MTDGKESLLQVGTRRNLSWRPRCDLQSDGLYDHNLLPYVFIYLRSFNDAELEYDETLYESKTFGCGGGCFGVNNPSVPLLKGELYDQRRRKWE